MRKNMIDKREKEGLTLETMATRCGVGRHLLEIIENGGVTHPDIAKQIGEGYGLTEKEWTELIPPNRRKGDSQYDPDKFNRESRIDRRRVPIRHAESNEADRYLHDHFLKVKKRENHRKRR